MPATPIPGSSRTLRVWLLLLAILAVAVSLRAYDLTGKCLWIDEANSVSIASEPVPERLATLRLDSSPPLYYFALRGWMDGLGGGEAAVRALSVVGGVLLVGLTFWIGSSLFSVRVGAIAACYLAVSPVQIFYSQQCRMYSWLTALSILSGFLLWRAVRSGRPRFIVGYALATLAALYLHNVAFYLLPGHLVILVWQRFWKRNLRWWVAATIVVLALYLPWMPTLLEQVRNETHYAWFQQHWEKMGPLGALGRSVVAFSPSFPELPFQFAEPVPVYVLAAVAASILALVGTVAGVVRAGGVVGAGGSGASGVGMTEASIRPNTIWAVLMCVLPLGSGILASVLLQPSYVPGRSDQIALPAFALLVSLGLSVIRPAWLRWTSVAGVLAIAGLSSTHYYDNESDRSEREIAQVIDQNSRAGDIVICTSLTRAPIEYYLTQGLRDRSDDDSHGLTILSFPRDTARHLGNQNDRELLSNPPRLAAEADSVWGEVHRIVRGREDVRVFVLVDLTEVNRAFHEALRSGQERIGYRELRSVGVFRQSGTGHRIGVDVAVFRNSS